jgi:hypothetical protein
MIPASLADKIEPCPGQLLVERLEMPVQRGRIILPNRARDVKSAEAVVVAPGVGLADEFPAGTVVVLSSSVQRDIQLGFPVERVLYVCRPSQILAIVRSAGEEVEVGVDDEHHLARWRDTDYERLSDHGLQEGDPGVPSV